MNENPKPPLDTTFTEIREKNAHSWRWIIAGLFLGLLPGGAALIFFFFLYHQPQPIPQHLLDQLAEMQGQVGQLQAQLKALPPPTDLTGLQGRLDQLEQGRPDLRPIQEQLANLTQEIGMLQANEKKLSDDMAALKAAPRPVAQDLALGLSLLHWRWTLETGVPFVDLLPAIERLAGDRLASIQPLLEEGKSFADQGALTLRQLQQRFPAREIAEAIQAQESNARGEGNRHWWTRIADQLSTLVIIRRQQPVGDDTPRDHLARAEQFVGEGDLKRAIAELETLPLPAAQWIAQANNRIKADHLAMQLDQLTIDLTGQ